MLMTEMPDLLQAAFPETVFNALNIWNKWPMGTICGGTVVLNDLEEFGRFAADETRSISRQMPRSQMWKTLESPGSEPMAPDRSEDCALSTQPNPQLQNRLFIGEF